MSTFTSGGSAAWKTVNTLLAAAGTATGITALGIKQGKNKGCGYNDNGYYSDGDGCPISRREAAKDAEIAYLRGQNETDAKIAAVYAELRANDKEANKQIAENAVQIALNAQKVTSNFQLVNREFACVDERFGRLETRVNNITKEVVPIDAVCPQPMPACAPISVQGSIIQTEPTDFSNTAVLGNAKAKV